MVYYGAYMDCVYCKLIRGQLPIYKVYENKHTLVFLDINPVRYGHSLVIPKEHYSNIYETPDDVLAELMQTAKRVALAIKQSNLAEGTNIHINNDPVAGQEITHTHIHVIPRSEKDGLALWPQSPYPDGVAEKTLKTLRDSLER